MTTHPHSHPKNPYAEPPSPPADEDASALARSDFGRSMASRVDRLIAFLDSHFGNVELVPEENPDEAVEAEEVEDGGVEVEKKGLLPPRIRVRLDDHWADVSLDDFVRPVAFNATSELMLTVIWQTVSSDYEPLEARARSVVDLAIQIVTPLVKLKQGDAKAWVANGSKRVRSVPVGSPVEKA